MFFSGARRAAFSWLVAVAAVAPLAFAGCGMLNTPSTPNAANNQTPSNAKHFNDANFTADVLGAQTPVLVDFWAPWCGPCRKIAPVIEELATENAGSVIVGKVNVDEAPQVAEKFRVESIPTLLLFKRGQVVAQFVGVQSKDKLQAAIDAAK